MNTTARRSATTTGRQVVTWASVDASASPVDCRWTTASDSTDRSSCSAPAATPGAAPPAYCSASWIATMTLSAVLPSCRGGCVVANAAGTSCPRLGCACDLPPWWGSCRGAQPSKTPCYRRPWSARPPGRGASLGSARRSRPWWDHPVAGPPRAMDCSTLRSETTELLVSNVTDFEYHCRTSLNIVMITNIYHEMDHLFNKNHIYNKNNFTLRNTILERIISMASCQADRGQCSA